MDDAPGTTPRAAPDHPWLLPATLVDDGAAAPAGTRRVQRTVRDWIVDLACFVFAAVFGLVMAVGFDTLATAPQPIAVADQVAAAVGCAGLWLRRRWPVGLAVVLVCFGTFSDLVAGAQLVALFTVAVHRRFRVVAGVGTLALASAPVFAWLRPDPELPFVGVVLFGATLTLAVIGWGMFVRARRQLVLSLRERARRAETEAELRAEQAQHRAREQIAREMHDVLGHRLSLLSVHAGALEYRPDAPPTEIAGAARVIRDSAHAALQDLREVIGVLRGTTSRDDPEDAAAEADRPQPALAGVAGLVEESRRAGMRITLSDDVGDHAAVPDAVGRAAYRIVQEALTNARKHAPGQPVTVTLTGAPERGLDVAVRNPVPDDAGSGAEAVPGTGQGLIGLTERATLAGGHLEHGISASGEFRLAAWLPWSS